MSAGARQSANANPVSGGWFAARRRLAGFAHTLRDNGFKVPLARNLVVRTLLEVAR